MVKAVAFTWGYCRRNIICWVHHLALIPSYEPVKMNSSHTCHWNWRCDAHHPAVFYFQLRSVACHWTFLCICLLVSVVSQHIQTITGYSYISALVSSSGSTVLPSAGSSALCRFITTVHGFTLCIAFLPVYHPHTTITYKRKIITKLLQMFFQYHQGKVWIRDWRNGLCWFLRWDGPVMV